MKRELRPYQVKGVVGIREAFRTHRRVLYVLPTGGGKTFIFSFIAESASSRGKRVLIMAHRKRIVRQISASLLDLDVRHGLVMAGHTMTCNPVSVGMIGTIARRLDRIAPPDLIIIDEGHHAVCGSYRKVMDRFPKAKILIVTASPERLDGKGMGDVADVIVEGPQPKELIAGGHLAPYRYLAPPPKADFSKIKKRAGDYAVDELAEVMNKAVITGDAVEHYRKHMNGLPSLAFCVNLKHAREVAATFRAAGFRSEHISGEMEEAEQERLLNGVATGQIQVLCCCDLISEGVDIKNVYGAILLRRSLSLTFFLQAIGRVLRPKDDGSPGTILDHVGCVHIHGLPDAERTWSLAGRDKSKDPPAIRTCETCYWTGPAGQKNPSCSFGTDCGLFSDRGEAGRAPPEQVDGELQIVADPFAWADSIDIKAARGAEWYRLLDLADGQPDRLKQIAKARGYHPRWIHHVARERSRGNSGGSDFQAREFAA